MSKSTTASANLPAAFASKVSLTRSTVAAKCASQSSLGIAGVCAISRVASFDCWRTAEAKAQHAKPSGNHPSAGQTSPACQCQSVGHRASFHTYPALRPVWLNCTCIARTKPLCRNYFGFGPNRRIAEGHRAGGWWTEGRPSAGPAGRGASRCGQKSDQSCMVYVDSEIVGRTLFVIDGSYNEVFPHPNSPICLPAFPVHCRRGLSARRCRRSSSPSYPWGSVSRSTALPGSFGCRWPSSWCPAAC